MKKNMGNTDRIIRIVLGIILASLFFILDGNIRYISIIGVILIITGLVGVCPLYLPLGIHTNKK